VHLSYSFVIEKLASAMQLLDKLMMRIVHLYKMLLIRTTKKVPMEQLIVHFTDEVSVPLNSMDSIEFNDTLTYFVTFIEMLYLASSFRHLQS
jgi:hypothetical protein